MCSEANRAGNVAPFDTNFILTCSQEDKRFKVIAEGPALETASALAAIAAVADGLGPYLSPYLPRLLSLLPSSQLLACRTAGCDSSAQAILTQLATAIPARLLLGPLAAHFPPSLQVTSCSAWMQTS